MIRRIMFLGIWVVLAVPFLFVAILSCMWAFAHWLRAGEDEDGRDRILLNPFLTGIADLPERILG